MNKYKQYRVRNNKGPVTDYLNGIGRSEDKKISLNKIKPFVPHWIEYRLVDKFKVASDPSLIPEPLLGKKNSSLCCRCFWLPGSPDEISQAYMDHKKWNDIDKIAPMIIHLGEFTCNPLKIGVPEHKLGNYYTCKHFSEETGACGNYENRPDMCKSHTYEKECEQCSTEPTCNGCIDKNKEPEIVIIDQEVA